MVEFREYHIGVEYTGGGGYRTYDATATLHIWERGEAQARGRAKQYVAAVVGEDSVYSTTLLDVSDPYDNPTNQK